MLTDTWLERVTKVPRRWMIVLTLVGALAAIAPPAYRSNAAPGYRRVECTRQAIVHGSIYPQRCSVIAHASWNNSFPRNWYLTNHSGSHYIWAEASLWRDTPQTTPVFIMLRKLYGKTDWREIDQWSYGGGTSAKMRHQNSPKKLDWGPGTYRWYVEFRPSSEPRVIYWMNVEFKIHSDPGTAGGDFHIP